MRSPALIATAASPLPERELPLAERIGEGAFVAFYDEVAPRLWAFLLAQTHDRSSADDLCQEAFTRVLASRLEPQSREHLTRYLFRTAIHLLRDRGRGAARAPLQLEERVDPADPHAAPEGLRADLERALARLDARQRRLIWLAHVEGLDHRTIAEQVGARPASVRVMLHRARRKLSQLLDRSPRPGVAP